MKYVLVQSRKQPFHQLKGFISKNLSELWSLMSLIWTLTTASGKPWHSTDDDQNRSHAKVKSQTESQWTTVYATLHKSVNEIKTPVFGSFTDIMEGFDQVRLPCDSHGRPKCTDGLYHFHSEPPEILSSALKNNPISGITCPRLLNLLYTKRRSIDWFRYKHRILALLTLSIFNSFLELLESIYMFYLCHINWNTKQLTMIARRDIKAPVFILGHPRTGTTLLHSLLALDEERFTFCDTFMAGFPHCFLFFETLGKFLFSGILSETRPMDNMKLVSYK